MKKWLMLAGLVLIAAIGYLLAAHLSGGRLPTLGLPLGGERAELGDKAMAFMEAIEFKDFEAAASFHSPADQAEADIPYLIQRLFQVKPETLEFMDYEVVLAKIDSSGNRARVKVRTKVKLLINDTIREQDIQLFFSRSEEGAPWYMELEDSLQKPESRM